MEKRSGGAARLLSWIPALACMAAIFYASSLPGNEIHLPDFRFSDKVAHALAYSIFGAALASRHGLRSRLSGEPAPSASPRDLITLAVGILYGVSDEIHQLFVPLRQFDYSDMAADAVGIMLGSWLWKVIAARRRRAVTAS